MNDFMKKVEIPGIVWAILIIIIVASVHSGESYLVNTLGIQPWIIDMGLAILIGVLKGLSLGKGQLDQALDIINKLMSYEAQAEARRVEEIASPREGMRSSYVTPVPPPLDMASLADEVPERPTKFQQFLFG